MGLQMSHESEAVLAYTTGINKLSIICWRVAYADPPKTLDSWIWQAYPATLMEKKPRNSLGLFPLTCEQHLWALSSLNATSGYLRICVVIASLHIPVPKVETDACSGTFVLVQYPQIPPTCCSYWNYAERTQVTVSGRECNIWCDQ